MRHRLAALEIADPPERWTALGFTVEGNQLELGGVRLELGAPGHGIVAWMLDPEVPEIDGLPTALDGTSARADLTPAHPNGAVGLDHVVVATPDFDRTAGALDVAGLPLRRIRDAGTFRQGFRRLGPAILELVEAKTAPPGPARFWGLVVTVSDLNALAEALENHLGEIKPAVQPGRRIATLKPTADLTPKVAFMTAAA